ncbi:twin-arginine translocation signal domain-containing protein [Streptomyces sp. NPDC003023]|uniref:twin-arginine translocation signal domain-containing protein n=1 Tax=Streptomyces sp. NPDC003023 TaxID=3364675 RepID=UPI00367DF6DB
MSVDRRRFLRTGTAAGALAVAGGAGLSHPAAATTPRTASAPAGRKPIVVGANPGLVLYDNDRLTAYAATWQIDWSPLGSGNVLVLWREETVHVYGTDPRLARWLEREFVRHFPEARGLVWPEPVVHRVPVRVDLDLASGLHVRAADVQVDMGDVLDRRAFATDGFPLDGVEHSLSLVLGPCGHGTIRAGGRTLAGQPRVGGTTERPTSTAYLAVSEVWQR